MTYLIRVSEKKNWLELMKVAETDHLFIKYNIKTKESEGITLTLP